MVPSPNHIEFSDNVPSNRAPDRNLASILPVVRLDHQGLRGLPLERYKAETPHQTGAR